MGSEKTTTAIGIMNQDEYNNYVFVTPYLDEVERVKSSCKNKNFYDPKNYDDSGFILKQESLHNLLLNNRNIVTTHALFRTSTEETRDLISSSDYILILDEVMDIVETLIIKKSDQKLLFDNDLLKVDEEGFIYWNMDNPRAKDYDGLFNHIKLMASNRSLFYYKGSILIWTFPIQIFESFKEVYILTYLFEGQIQKTYYDMFNIDYEYYITNKKHSQGFGEQLHEYVYEFTPRPVGHSDKDIRTKLRDKIHVYEGKLNTIGDGKYSLSKSWYEKKKVMVTKLKNNTSNYFKNIMKAKSSDVLWTTFKSYEKDMTSKGIKSSFISCTLRATNEYKDRTVVAYTINRFVNPVINGFFIEKGASIDQDLWATSELIQFIWRSAIREDNDIHVYIPSERMRRLLYEWLDS